jgi:hypothetical protein
LELGNAANHAQHEDDDEAEPPGRADGRVEDPNPFVPSAMPGAKESRTRVEHRGERDQRQREAEPARPHEEGAAEGGAVGERFSVLPDFDG